MSNATLKGIKINFISDTNKIDAGASFDLDNYVTENESLMQNALVNAFLKKGSDKLNNTRGTDLLEHTRYYSVYNFDELIHVGNFAAMDTHNYINEDILSFAEDSPYNEQDVSKLEYTTAENMEEPLLNSFTLTPNLTINNDIIYNAELSTTKGVVIGSNAIIPELL